MLTKQPQSTGGPPLPAAYPHTFLKPLTDANSSDAEQHRYREALAKQKSWMNEQAMRHTISGPNTDYENLTLL